MWMLDLKSVRITIVDDDEDDYFLTKEYISKIGAANFQVDWCYRYDEALERIKQEKSDIFFIDYRLGAKTGLDLLKEAMKGNCEKPLILLTGKGNQKIDLEAMQAGATDYLIKSELNTEKLERCIRYALERTISLKQLKANERKFRGIFEKSKDAVFLAEENLAFRDINPAATDLLGYSKSEFMKLSLFDLLANPTDVLLFKKFIADEGEIKDREIELMTRGSDRVTCILSVSREMEVNGSRYTQGIIHDISNLKKAEKTTLQIEKLRAAGRLVSTLAHEVRNPLNNINLSVSQLIAEINGNSETRIFLDIIDRNSRRIADIITELLSSSRPAELVLVKVQLQDIIRETIIVAADRLALKKIDMDIQYPEIPLFVLADAEKLNIAFLNIIINAIEAMNEGKGILTINFDSDDKYHRVKISDNGTGINAENLARLFEPYFTSKRNGLGLGLASTLNIIESNKGLIDVQSFVGEGTTFLLSFEKA
jgi:PAS domain S-box-containing protein